MILNQLTSFILRPHAFIKEAHTANVRTLSLISMFCAALVAQIDSASSFSRLIIGTLLGLVSICTLTFLQSVTQDFIAQHLRLKAQSVTLFYWLGISFIPYALYIPLTILSRLPQLTLVTELAKLLIFLWVCVLQIKILKHRYSISTFLSSIIYLFPFIFIGLTVFLLFIIGITLA